MLRHMQLIIQNTSHKVNALKIIKGNTNLFEHTNMPRICYYSIALPIL